MEIAMEQKEFLLTTLFVGLSATTITAFANPLGWFERVPFERNGTDLDRKIGFAITGWPDGSAEVLITSLFDLPQNQMPGNGLVRINDTTFKFAPRMDNDGKEVFYASIPVDTVPLLGQFEFEMLIEDKDGNTMIRRSFEYGFED